MARHGRAGESAAGATADRAPTPRPGRPRARCLLTPGVRRRPPCKCAAAPSRTPPPQQACPRRTAPAAAWPAGARRWPHVPPPRAPPCRASGCRGQGMGCARVEQQAAVSTSSTGWQSKFVRMAGGGGDWRLQGRGAAAAAGTVDPNAVLLEASRCLHAADRWSPAQGDARERDGFSVWRQSSGAPSSERSEDACTQLKTPRSDQRRASIERGRECSSASRARCCAAAAAPRRAACEELAGRSFLLCATSTVLGYSLPPSHRSMAGPLLLQRCIASLLTRTLSAFPDQLTTGQQSAACCTCEQASTAAASMLPQPRPRASRYAAAGAEPTPTLQYSSALLAAALTAARRPPGLAGSPGEGPCPQTGRTPGAPPRPRCSAGLKWARGAGCEWWVGCSLWAGSGSGERDACLQQVRWVICQACWPRPSAPPPTHT